MSLLKRILRSLSVRNARFEGLYRRIGSPNGLQWADMLRERGDFYSMGDHCSIDPHALIEGRATIRFGNNVRLAACSVFCHDGSVNMINRAHGLSLDRWERVDFRDNVFIGYQAVILPGVTIGPNAIVAAGSVVRSDVAEGDIVSGVPAKPVGRVDKYLRNLQARNEQYPWRYLIEQRKGEFDPAFEPELLRLRVEYLFGSDPD